MIGKGEMELCIGGAGTGGGYDLAIGGGATVRYGVDPNCTLGIGGDLNTNMLATDWANPIVYGSLAFEQKFALFPDKIPNILAIKLKEGFTYNNYTGYVLESETTGLDELVIPTPYVPFGKVELIASINDTKNSHVMPSFILHGLYGARRHNSFTSFGAAIAFDIFNKGPERRHAGGFEFGAAYFQIDGREDLALKLGIHFSIFRKGKG
jgi:hypothetical protein